MKKSNDFIKKKQVKKSIENAIEMNNCSLEYLESILEKYDDVFTGEEKENLNNLRKYLDETLNVFFTKLMPK